MSKRLKAQAETRSRLTLWMGAGLALLSLACSSGIDAEKQRENAEYHYKLANGHFYQKEIVHALRELTECLKIEPDHPDAHHLMGFIFFGRKEHATAERHFRKALSLRGAFHEARANLGAVLLAMKRWQEAIEALGPLQNATLYSTPWLVHNNLGYAYEQLGQRSQALKHYRMSVFHNAKFCLGYNNLGALYRKMGQRDLAIDYLMRAIKRCEKYAEPHFHLGTIYEDLGRVRDARIEFKQCFDVAPESAVGRRCRMRM